MSNTLELRGRTVIVTGASSGIGEATAHALHAAGARPVLAARRTERLKTLSAQLGGALYVQTDVTDAGRVAHLVAATLKRHGRIDALVNNAGSEGVNRLIKTDARCAFGYRNPVNQRLRARCATTRRARGHLGTHTSGPHSQPRRHSKP
jgi:NADP-dependent 3-hydroxy acid dehydrogenase YdfG